MTRQFVTNGDGIVAAAGDDRLGDGDRPDRRGRRGRRLRLLARWSAAGCSPACRSTSAPPATPTRSRPARVIPAVDYSNPAAPTVTMPSAIATTAGTHFFYIPNPNSATAPNPELNGLRQIIGSGALGGLNPRHRRPGVLARRVPRHHHDRVRLDLALNLQRYVLQNSNQPGTDVWTGYRQQANFYALLQNQVQFAGDQNLAAGNVNGPKWNGMTRATRSPTSSTPTGSSSRSRTSCRVTSAMTKPTWASDIEGVGPVDLLEAGHDAVRRRPRLPAAGRRASGATRRPGRSRSSSHPAWPGPFLPPGGPGPPSPSMPALYLPRLSPRTARAHAQSSTPTCCASVRDYDPIRPACLREFNAALQAHRPAAADGARAASASCPGCR